MDVSCISAHVHAKARVGWRKSSRLILNDSFRNGKRALDNSPGLKAAHNAILIALESVAFPGAMNTCYILDHYVVVLFFSIFFARALMDTGATGLMPVLTMERVNDAVETKQYWRDVDKVKRILRYVIPRSSTRSDEVAIAGSAALHWYQRQEGIGPSWSGIGDIDIFVSGQHGTTVSQFKRFLTSVIENLLASEHQIAAFKCYPLRLYGAASSRNIIICDIEIVGIDLKLSFVQSPGSANVSSVVDGFDIDICQVRYDIHRQTYHVRNQTRDNIRRRRAVVFPLVFDSSNGDISPADRTRVRKTLQRIKKYHDRGYKFVNGGGLNFSP